MPLPRKGGTGATVSAPASRQGGLPRKSGVTPSQQVTPTFDETTTETESSGVSPGAVVGGAGLLAGLAYGASKMKNAPGILGKIGKGAEMLNAVRQQAMLSGTAIPKSVLGNIGAGVEEAVEGGGFRALKEILSPRTAREAYAAMKTPAASVANPAGAATQLPGWLSIPGRILGGADEATQAALQRAGKTATEARSKVLQAPLTGDIGTALESPVMRAVIPFRRTPFNQLIEGAKKIKAGTVGGDAAARRGLVTYGTAGAVHGAATSDDQYPTSVPIAAAASARYGLPYALAALLGRSVAGGKGGGGIAGSAAVPVSEYGVEQSVTQPLRPLYEPAVLKMLKRILGEE